MLHLYNLVIIKIPEFKTLLQTVELICTLIYVQEMGSQGDIKSSIMTLLISSIEYISWRTAKKYLSVESRSQINDKIYVTEVIWCH